MITTIITYLLIALFGSVVGIFIYRNNRDELNPTLDKIAEYYEKIEKKINELEKELKKKEIK